MRWRWVIVIFAALLIAGTAVYVFSEDRAKSVCDDNGVYEAC